MFGKVLMVKYKLSNIAFAHVIDAHKHAHKIDPRTVKTECWYDCPLAQWCDDGQ